MSKKIFFFYISLIVIVLAGIVVVLNSEDINKLNDEDVVACTMDAKMCPDGSYVGRSGPKCEFSPCPISQIENQVSINQKISIGEVSITPLKVISDSRCPKGVQCIWAGTVSVNIKLEKEGGIQETEVELGKPITFAGDMVSLVSVSPEKNSKDIDSSDYRFTFSVTASQSSTKVSGRVTISPTCPVERIPPDPNCAPRGYKTTVSVKNSGGKSVMSAVTDDSGNFAFDLTAGSYTFEATSGKPFPSCSPVVVKVINKNNEKVSINCDSGIR